MKPSKELRGAIFDLDGTLLDSLDSWSEVDRRFFAKRGLTLPEDYFGRIKALDLKETACFTKETFSLPEPPEQIVEEWLGLIREEYALRVGLKPYARELLVRLRARGVKLAIATSSSPELFLPALTRCGVADFFSAFVTTRDVGRGKTFPDVYLEAARRIGVLPGECAVFEDLLAGVASAKAGGFFAVAVSDVHSKQEEAELRAAADLFLPDFSAWFCEADEPERKKRRMME